MGRAPITACCAISSIVCAVALSCSDGSSVTSFQANPSGSAQAGAGGTTNPSSAGSNAASAGELGAGGETSAGGHAGSESSAAGAGAGTLGDGGQAGAAGNAGQGAQPAEGGASGQAAGGSNASGSGAGGSNAGNSNAGSGGVSGGGGASGSGGASGGGAGGSGGGVTGHKLCAEACQNDGDCEIGSADLGFNCDLSTHRCQKLGNPCTSSLACVPAASLWFLDCTSDADCFYFADDVCVSVAGAGKCARLAPGNDVEASGCQAPTQNALLLPRLGASGTALVCADASQKCEAGACLPSCQSDAECTPARNGSVCDLASGSCRCLRDQDCAGAGVSRCNVASGACECAGAPDCAEVPGADVCVAGRCSCSSAAACNAEPLFAGTTFVCE